MLTVRSIASLIARCAKLAVANYCCLLGLIIQITELDPSFMLVHFGVFLIELSFKLTGCTGLQWTSLFIYFYSLFGQILSCLASNNKKRKVKSDILHVYWLIFSKRN